MMFNKFVFRSLILFLILPCSLTSCEDQQKKNGPLKDRIKSDERVVFFSTAGWKSDDGRTWNLPVHGWIYEPEKDSAVREGVSKLVEQYFEDEGLNEARRKRFRKRLRYFIADNEGGKELTIRIAGKRVLLPESDGDGRFRTVLSLPVERVREYARNGKLTYRAVPGGNGQSQPYTGTIHLFEPNGVTVISDIDDTIKISNVTDKAKLLKNTFLKPFRPVSGMSELYGSWTDTQNTNVIYLSNSPWQLYPPLHSFVEEHQYPAAPFDLLRVQFDDTRIMKLFETSEKKKWSRLNTYFERYPERTFVLVGDSGEEDPEIYGKLAQIYPDRVRAILIRNVTGEDPDADRFREAFKTVPNDRWTVFNDPDELSDVRIDTEQK